MNTVRTMIVPANRVNAARTVAAIGIAGGSGMFMVGLSSDGGEPPSHYISTGHVTQEFFDLLEDPQALVALPGAGLNVAAAVQLVNQMDRIDRLQESAQETLARLGLQVIQQIEDDVESAPGNSGGKGKP